MDGPSSGFPSTSVASTTNPELGTSSFVPSNGIDPPRPAREGCEWVWFPGGYWAERQIAETPVRDLPRAFRWRKRSGKSGSESPKHSPRTLLTNSSLADKTEDSLDGRRSLTRTTESSESSSSLFPSNRTPDGYPPSPYLTEEAHVQSLQWPSIDAATSSSSMTGRPMLKSRPVLSPSPLQFSNEIVSDTNVPSTIRRPEVIRASSDSANTETLIPSSSLRPKPKPKRQFINWRVMTENRLRIKRLQASGAKPTDEKRILLPELASRPEASSLGSPRKKSTVSDKSHKSLKGLSRKLFPWSSKGSSASKVSLSTSLRESAPSHSPAPTLVSEKTLTNAWNSEYPGGEAMRIRTPPIIQKESDQFPRSFFSVLKPPSTPPASCTERHPSLEKRPLSAPHSAPLSGSTPSSGSRPWTRPTEYYYNDSGSGGRGATPMSATASSSNKSRREPPAAAGPKEWWEVPVPYGAVDKRTFKFDMPEHLPSSPMCPANKRHKSGGTGVCVYHGRAKRSAKTTSSETGEGTSKGGNGGGVDDNDNENASDSDEAGSDLWK
ncbi:hypothetical protein F5Y10DRAFT_289910 [Nemania abortiva]|nr:hypothetical protein F5Y10DRAFT_289910 [Nemania abortiva]